MGDRANILMIDEPRTESGIYLYTHSRGHEWPERLRLALAEAIGRWDDPQYGIRICVTSLFRDLDGCPIGGGISTVVGDGEDRVVVVSWPDQTVTYGASSWTFAEFVALPVAPGWGS